MLTLVHKEDFELDLERVRLDPISPHNEWLNIASLSELVRRQRESM